MQIIAVIGDEEKLKENKMEHNEKIINAESLNMDLDMDSTLEELSKELKSGESLVLDIGNNYFHQTDEIYDILVMQGYDVKKSFRNGRNQIIVHKKMNLQ